MGGSVMGVKGEGGGVSFKSVHGQIQNFLVEGGGDGVTIIWGLEPRLC